MLTCCPRFLFFVTGTRTVFSRLKFVSTTIANASSISSHRCIEILSSNEDSYVVCICIYEDPVQSALITEYNRSMVFPVNSPLSIIFELFYYYSVILYYILQNYVFVVVVAISADLIPTT